MIVISSVVEKQVSPTLHAFNLATVPFPLLAFRARAFAYFQSLFLFYLIKMPLAFGLWRSAHLDHRGS